MSFDKNYDANEAEPKWQRFWEEEGLFKYNRDDERPAYSIDTPPPTVSGTLHIGHVFSYTQTEIIARYQRMRGRNVMYPFGFDDNGLPTEILTEKETGKSGRDLPRAEFVNACEEVSAKYRQQFKELWQRLGFSCDWDSAYSTISESSQRISQRSFLDLYQRGALVRREMPTLWCCKCQTAFAQAEVDDVHIGTVFNYLNFTADNGDPIPIATTRPELLSSCVSMFIHPENSKYAHLIGREAIVPLFGHRVPILADEKADPEKGTGIVMCCTFGDITDIDWWREHKLDLRVSFTADGRMNELAGPYEGMTIKEARKAIIEALLADDIIFKQEDIDAEKRVVNTHERCGTEVEYLNTKQWFIKVVDCKDELIAQGQKINWFPAYMGRRYENWVENLSWDWAISRQRYFGVPVPAWYCDDCGETIVADSEQLPVNPQVDRPAVCPSCGSKALVGDPDVLDTWATSSVTPQLNAHWGEANEDPALRPMSMRPQAHDIIRTWAFYTIVKSYYHFNDVPWHDAVISGHVIKRDEEKISKSDDAKVEGKQYTRKSKISKSKDGNRFSPMAILDRFPADSVRYWATSGTLGTDIAFDETEIKNNNRLLTKLWNSSRFAATFLEDFTPDHEPQLEAIDRWILGRFNRVIDFYHQSYTRYEFFPARNELEQFFWASFCDNYLEYIKDRLYEPDRRGAESAYAARWTLYRLLYQQLQMFAPYVPHITEEIYQTLFREREGAVSIHVTELPTSDATFGCDSSSQAGDLLVDLVTLVRTYKSKHNYSMKLPVDELTVVSNHAEALQLVEADIKAVTQSANVTLVESADEATLFEGRTDDLQIAVEMNAQAVFRTELVAQLKPVITQLKKDAGLKSKNPITRVLVQANEELTTVLNSEPGQVAAAGRAQTVAFNEDGIAYTSTDREGLAVAIEV